MAKRKTPKPRSRRPPVDRPKQRAATSALTRRQPSAIQTRPPTVVTLASIAELRQTITPRVRVGRIVETAGEYGASGTLNVYGRIFNDDYNTLFDGKNGLTIYDQMDRSDGQVGSASEIIKLPIRAAKFICEYPKDATQKEKDITDALNAALFENTEWPNGESWDFYLRHLLMRVTHGFGLLEKVWMFDENIGLLRWKRLAPRLPRTVTEFMPNPDGSLRAIVQYVSIPGTGRFENRTIPAEYAILSVREREGDNYYGRSIYRRIYKHWFYKDEAYRIDGIRLDRYGVGIPVAKIEPTHVLDANELNEIELTLQALRTHERAYIIEPPDVTFRIMVPDGGHGGATGLMESVQHHDTMIVRGTLATFMSDHAEGLNTNRTRTLADIFLHSLKAEANAIAGDLQSQAIRPFCDVNFDMSDARYPIARCVGLGDMTVDQLATALGPLIGEGGAITPEDTLEDHLRSMLGLPPLPQGWKRGDKKPAPPPVIPTNGNGNGNGPGAQPNNDGGRAEDEPNVTEPDEPVNAAVLLAMIDYMVKSFEKQQTQPPPQPADQKDEGAERIITELKNLALTVEKSAVPPPPPAPINITLPPLDTVPKRVERDPMSGRITRVIPEPPKPDDQQ